MNFIAGSSVLFPDVEVKPENTKSAGSSASSDTFLPVLGRENTTPLSAAALDNL